MAITLGISGLKETRRRYQRLASRLPLEAVRSVVKGAERGRTEFLKRTTNPEGLSTLKRPEGRKLVKAVRKTGKDSAGFVVLGKRPRIQHYAGTTFTKRKQGSGGIVATGRVNFRTKRGAPRSSLRGFAIMRGGVEVWIRRATPTDLARRSIRARNPKYKVGTIQFTGYPLANYALDPRVFRPVQALMLSVTNRELDTRIARLMRR